MEESPLQILNKEITAGIIEAEGLGRRPEGCEEKKERQ